MVFALAIAREQDHDKLIITILSCKLFQFFTS